MKTWTKKHAILAICAALFAGAALTLLEPTEQTTAQPRASTRTTIAGQADSSGVFSSPVPSSPARSGDLDSDEAGLGETDSGFVPPSQAQSDFGSSPALSGGDAPDTGSDAVTQGYWQRQATQDGVIRDMDNGIKDEVTLQNPDTGEVTQGQAGSSDYYQSPSVDAALGESTVIGTDGGTPISADATQLNVVTGASSSSDAGGTP